MHTSNKPHHTGTRPVHHPLPSTLTLSHAKSPPARRFQNGMPGGFHIHDLTSPEGSKQPSHIPPEHFPLDQCRERGGVIAFLHPLQPQPAHGMLPKLNILPVAGLFQREGHLSTVL